MSVTLSTVPTKSAAATAAPAPEKEVYAFDETFQNKITALMIRDTKFLQRTEGLIEPVFFEEAANGVIADIALKYYDKYRKAPGDMATVKMLLKELIGSKLIRSDLIHPVIDKFREENDESVYKTDISDRDFVIDKVSEFAKHQALMNAILKGAEILTLSRDFGAIEALFDKARNTGAAMDSGEYDYFANLERRTLHRKERAAGIAKPTGITTGYAAFDTELYHKGWGRSELSVLLGGAKAGKTTALISFGVNAMGAGYNVLYVTLEVSADIISDRMDANISDVLMMELDDYTFKIEEKIKEFQAKAGKFLIREMPTGSMTVSGLRRMIEQYKAQGVTFDLVIVDYADLMAPERWTDNAQENSKNVYVNLRGLAMSEGFAVLTATQTNREGFKSSVAKAEHVAEDFNKIRIADLIISINKTDEERAVGEARLYFAASRNQAGNFTIRIQQDIDRMKFITKIIGKD